MSINIDSNQDENITSGRIANIIQKYINHPYLSHEAKNTAYQIEQELITAIRTELNKVIFTDKHGTWSYSEDKIDARTEVMIYLLGSNGVKQ